MYGDEEKAKLKAKVMAAAIAKRNHRTKTHSYKEVMPQSGQKKSRQEEFKANRAPWERRPKEEKRGVNTRGPIYHFCKEIGHLRLSCLPREKDM